MPSRPLLDEKSVSAAALAAMEGFRADVVREVQETVRRDHVVVVDSGNNRLQVFDF